MESGPSKNCRSCQKLAGAWRGWHMFILYSQLIVDYFFLIWNSDAIVFTSYMRGRRSVPSLLYESSCTDCGEEEKGFSNRKLGLSVRSSGTHLKSRASQVMRLSRLSHLLRTQADDNGVWTRQSCWSKCCNRDVLKPLGPPPLPHGHIMPSPIF